MIRRDTGFGCGCGPADIDSRAYAVEAVGFGGVFTKLLNVAGSFVGDPALGSQIAATALPGYAKIKETPEQIAAHVAPDVRAVLSTGALRDPATLSPQAKQIAAGVAAQVAAELERQGFNLAPGTVGAELQDPSYLNAFGGQNARWVLVGGLGLGALLLLKAFRT